MYVYSYKHVHIYIAVVVRVVGRRSIITIAVPCWR